MLLLLAEPLPAEQVKKNGHTQTTQVSSLPGVTLEMEGLRQEHNATRVRSCRPGTRSQPRLRVSLTVGFRVCTVGPVECKDGLCTAPLRQHERQEASVAHLCLEGLKKAGSKEFRTPHARKFPASAHFRTATWPPGVPSCIDLALGAVLVSLQIIGLLMLAAQVSTLGLSL